MKRLLIIFGLLFGAINLRAVTINSDDSNIIYVGRWAHTGSGATAKAVTINAGSFIEFSVTGANSITMNFDNTDLNSGGYPDILYQVDGGSVCRVSLTSSNLVITTTFPVSGITTHHMRIYAEGITVGTAPSAYDQWNNKGGALIFSNLTIDAGSTIPLGTNPNTMEIFGDSIVASDRELSICGGGSNDTALCMSGHNSFTQIASKYLGLSPVQSGFGGTGLTLAAQSGTAFVPESVNSFPYVYAGVSYSPTYRPIVVVVEQGTNESAVAGATWRAALTTYLTTIRTAYPRAFIFCMGLPTNTHAADMGTVVSSLGDGRVFYLDYTGLTIPTVDGIHPNTGGHTVIGTYLGHDIQAQLNTSGVVLSNIVPLNGRIGGRGTIQ